MRLVVPARRPGRYTAALAVIAVAGVFGIVSLNAVTAEHAFAARAYQEQIADLALRHDELTATVAALESPERVRRAAEQLGMMPASSPRFLQLAGASTGARTDARADDLVDPVKPTLGARD